MLVEPAAAPGTAQAFFVAARTGGRARRAPPAAWRAPAAAGLARLRAMSDRPPDHLPPEALEEVAIVEERLRQRAGHPGAVSLAPGWRDLTALAAVGRAVERVLADGPARPEDDEEGFAASAA